MKYKIYLAFAFMILFLISFASAEIIFPENSNFKAGNIDLKIVCFEENSSYCSSDCEAEILKPDLSRLIYSPMERQTSFYNLSFETFELGYFKAFFKCGDKHKEAVFKITSNAEKNSTSRAIIIIMLSFALVLLVLGVYAENEYLGFMSGALFLVSGIFLIIYGLGDLSSLYTRTLGWVSVAFGLIFSFIAGEKALED